MTKGGCHFLMLIVFRDTSDLGGGLQKIANHLVRLLFAASETRSISHARMHVCTCMGYICASCAQIIYAFHLCFKVIDDTFAPGRSTP